VRVSTQGGRWPRFGPTGRLYYWSTSRSGLRRVDYQTSGDRFVAEASKSVWPGTEDQVADFARRVLVTATYAGYDVDPATGRFLVLERIAPAEENPPRRPVLDFGRP
jgi:hypothetical protein